MLTTKKMAFCRERMKGLNCVQCALNAGYAQRTADSASSWIRETRELSLYPPMYDYLEMLKERALILLDIDQEWLLAKMVNVAKGNVYDYFDVIEEEVEGLDDEGCPTFDTVKTYVAKSRSDLTESEQCRIKKLTHGKFTVELIPQMQALEILREEMGGLGIVKKKVRNRYSVKDIDPNTDNDSIMELYGDILGGDS